MHKKELKTEAIFGFYSKSSLMLNDPYHKKIRRTQGIRHYTSRGGKVFPVLTCSHLASQGLTAALTLSTLFRNDGLTHKVNAEFGKLPCLSHSPRREMGEVCPSSAWVTGMHVEKYYIFSTTEQGFEDFYLSFQNHVSILPVQKVVLVSYT